MMPPSAGPNQPSQVVSSAPARTPTTAAGSTAAAPESASFSAWLPLGRSGLAALGVAVKAGGFHHSMANKTAMLARASQFVDDVACNPGVG